MVDWNKDDIYTLLFISAAAEGFERNSGFRLNASSSCQSSDDSSRLCDWFW